MSPIDALVVLNQIAIALGEGRDDLPNPTGIYPDVNGDQSITSVDAQLVLTYLDDTGSLNPPLIGPTCDADSVPSVTIETLPADVNAVQVFTNSASVFDDDGGADATTTTITVNDVNYDGELTVDWFVNRLDVDGNWIGVSDNEASHINDQLRWTASLPSIATVTAITWLKKPWNDLNDDSIPWQQFASSSSMGPCPCHVYGTPDIGIWAVRPVVTYANSATPFVQQIVNGNVRQQVVFKIHDVTFEGVNAADSATNLSEDNPGDTGLGYSMGGGWRYFFGRNTPQGPLHNRLNLLAKVTPDSPKIKLVFRVVDADDPTDFDGPIDADPGLADNRGTYESAPFNMDRVGVSGEFTVFKSPLTGTNMYPGDNFRYIVAPRGDRLDRVKPRSSLTVPELQGRAYYDENNNGTQANTEPILPTAQPLDISGNTFVSSPLLTLWTTLHVEVDSMATPLADEAFTAEDPRPEGPLPRPDTSALAAAFQKSFIAVAVNTDSSISQNNIPFRKSLGASPTDATNFLKQYWQTSVRETGYYSLQIVGVYELDSSIRDNDDDTELAVLGYNLGFGTGASGPIAIPNEVIRDVAAQQGPGRTAWTSEQLGTFRKALVVHEVGHSFGLAHSPTFPQHAMSAHENEAEEALLYELSAFYKDSDIRKIRDNGVVL